LMKYLHKRFDSITPSNRFESVSNLSKLKVDSQITLSKLIGVEILSNNWVSFAG